MSLVTARIEEATRLFALLTDEITAHSSPAPNPIYENLHKLMVIYFRILRNIEKGWDHYNYDNLLEVMNRLERIRDIKARSYIIPEHSVSEANSKEIVARCEAPQT